MPNNSEKQSDLKYLVIESVPSEEYFTDQGFAAFQSYMGNVLKGQSKIYTAPFAKGQSIHQVLSDWMKELESLSTQWPTLVDFEKDLASKVGPMSVQLPLSERMGDIAHYYGDILLSSKPVQSSAIDSVIEEFSAIRGLRLRSQVDTVNLMKKSTNSGPPYFTKKREVVKETVPTDNSFVVQSVPHMYANIDSTNNEWYGSTAAVVGWRGQEGGPSEEDVKQRVIWMFPFGVNINELQVYQPFIEECQRHLLVPAWVSMELVDERVTKLFDSKADNDLVVCTDFSKFDQHFNLDMQEAAKAILNGLLAHGDISQRWLERKFPIKYNIPLLIGYDDRDVKVCVGPHGMASGSGGTNCDETIAHRALQYEAAQTYGAALNPNSQCLGDDGILSYPGITVEDVVKAYSRHGLEMNMSKQYASTQDCVYLRRWHHKDYRSDGVCVGVYSTCRAIGRLRYLERFMNPSYWSPELVALRQLSIIENCKWHPMRDQFAQFCMARDKYRLGLDIPGFLDNVTQIAKEAVDHMQDFLGYTKTLQGEGPTGISSWWIVKYLKSQR